MNKRINAAVHTYDASRVQWKGNEGIVDASELGIRAGHLPYDRLYDDACDVGLKLRNPVMDTTCVFVLEYSTCTEDDITSWVLKSIDGKISLIILND